MWLVATLSPCAPRCSVIGRRPSGGRLYNELPDTRPWGRLSAVRAVMPSPPSSAAHRPCRLGLVAAMRYGMFAASRCCSAHLRKAHCGPSTAKGNGRPRVGSKVEKAIQTRSSWPSVWAPARSSCPMMTARSICPFSIRSARAAFPSSDEISGSSWAIGLQHELHIPRSREPSHYGCLVDAGPFEGDRRRAGTVVPTDE